MKQKTLKFLKPLHMGTHLRVLNESFPMNSNMTQVSMVFNFICILVLCANEAVALEGLRITGPDVSSIIDDPVYTAYMYIIIRAPDSSL